MKVFLEENVLPFMLVGGTRDLEIPWSDTDTQVYTTDQEVSS